MNKEESSLPEPPEPPSPILRRILAINILALLILVAGLLYHGQYRQSLINQELVALRVHAEILAAALGESATEFASPDGQRLQSNIAVQMVRRLVETTGGRARLFAPDGVLIADSRQMAGSGGSVLRIELPEPDSGRNLGRKIFDWPFNIALDAYEGVLKIFHGGRHMPLYRDPPVQNAREYAEAVAALQGEATDAVRRTTGNAKFILSTAVPVQSYKQVLGALMLTQDSRQIEETLRQVQLNIVEIFVLALTVTVLLSFYLARTIVGPIRRLAAAAERVRHGHHRQHTIPDFACRGDEIGELSVALKEMTEALWSRMDAIDSFAADVSHEIKNPLTSLRSAVETAARISDVDQQKKLMDIILDDVERLDRLIGDISDASRLDAELSRATTGPVDLDAMLSALTQAHGTDPHCHYEYSATGSLTISGIESRLGQVFANLLTNAASFNPPGGVIKISGDGQTDKGQIIITIDDQGPGIPEDRRQTIFERFYSERPKAEKFGTHSGLGLSISKQIIEAHDGTITAENLVDSENRVSGARFTVRLPRG